MHSFNLHKFWWMYKLYAGNYFLWVVWKSSRCFYATNALSDISEKSIIKFAFPWRRCKLICSLDKNMSTLEKQSRVDLITSINFVKTQHRRWMNCIWTFHQQNVARFLGLKELRRGLGGRCLWEGACSLGSRLNIWQWRHEQSSPNF